MEAKLRNEFRLFVCLHTLFCLLSIASRCEGAEYALGSVSLRKTLSNDVAANYNCAPRVEFSNTVKCDLKKLPAASSHAPQVADTLIKSSDGQILYAYHKSREAGDLDQVATKLTEETSKALGGLASRRFSLDEASVLVWGDVKLEEISSYTDEYAGIKGLIEQKYGLLVTTTDDFHTSEEDRGPVYRVIGGDGLVIIISQNKSRQAVVQRFIVAAGELAERNFGSQARQFLAQDRASSLDDFLIGLK